MKKGYTTKNFFYLANGRIIKSLPNLLKELKHMNKEVYNHHVGSHKNDFSTWIEHEFKLKQLAGDIRNKNRKKAIKVLKEFLSEKKIKRKKKQKEIAKKEAKHQPAKKMKTKIKKKKKKGVKKEASIQPSKLEKTKIKPQEKPKEIVKEKPKAPPEKKQKRVMTGLFSSLKRKKQKLEKEIKGKEEEIEKLRERAIYNYRVVKLSEKEIGKRKAVVENLDRDYKEISGRLTDKTGLLKNYDKKLVKVITLAKGRHRGLLKKQREVNSHIKRIEHLNKSLAMRQESHDLMKQEHDKVERELAQIKGEHSKRLREHELLQTRLKELQKTTGEEEKREIIIHKKFDHYNSILNQIQSQVKEKQNELAMIDENIKKSTTNLNELRVRERSMKAEIKKNKNEIEALKKIMEENMKLIESKQADFIEREKQLFDRGSKIKEEELKIKSKSRLIADKLGDIEKRERALEKKERELQNIEEKPKKKEDIAAR